MKLQFKLLEILKKILTYLIVGLTYSVVVTVIRLRALEQRNLFNFRQTQGLLFTPERSD
jgi:predicted Kef-type K+ transport protein